MNNYFEPTLQGIFGYFSPIIFLGQMSAIYFNITKFLLVLVS